jgi:uncharacterized protein with ParB-like and HNH nuclease domain
MFEVINNRGKQLSELEKVKNYLIYCSIKLSAFSLRDDITEHWSDILQSLNKAKKHHQMKSFIFKILFGCIF